ncbi:unnamed protein product [Brachionus calyciflorus]|uniref:Uncharacterized protein n=1 Tax=Brachionus calyciflorus TaxID=104777 RepID=A0A813T3N1_9BILA|nr:unnamed protein product [Brachionus calyciflorus]
MINQISNNVTQQQQQQQQQTTTDALIINSNSTTVSDELILQLQEQFGDSKQIYILNTANNSVSSSSSYNNSTNNNTNTIQYLIVDKDVDINAILQDPSIFQNQQQAVTNQPTQQVNNQNHVTTPIQTKSQIQQPQNHHLLAEESIQRVTAPPPKRKQFEYKIDTNKRMSYQDAFLRFLAGEKQPTLEINTNEHANKKPKDNIYYNFYLNNPKLTTQNTNTQSSVSVNTPTNNPNPPVVITNGNTNVVFNTSNMTTGNNDKENYYNSSRRENLLPLNNYEYRNSYKDHYDNQGVRINPALFKNLPGTSQTKPVKQIDNKIETPKIINHSIRSNDILEPKIITPNSTLNDHTYKTNSDTKILQRELSQTDLDLNSIKRKPSLNDDITIIEPEPIKPKQNKIDLPLNQQDILPNVNTITNTSELSDMINFSQGEFLIHKPTFSGDFDNYEIWCVLDEQYLQKYEPVLLSTGERCHQSADVLAQYTANKAEFLLVKVEEKGKTENNNIVVGVLPEFEPKNNPKIAAALLPNNNVAAVESTTNETIATEAQNANVVVVTYDDLKSAFDVFVQVMSSQYLNGEFLLKIKEIHDEYFKPSIEFIETILTEKYNLLFNCVCNFVINLNNKLKMCFGEGKTYVELKEDFKYLLEHKPKLLIQKVAFDNVQIQKLKKCESFNFFYDISTNGSAIGLDDSVLNVNYLVQFSGNLYDSDTLVPLAGTNLNDKQFLVCAKMCNFVNLLHSLKHFKIAYLEICSQKIESIKIQLNSTNSLNTNPTDENNSNTEILNYCLADNQWLLEMFEKFKQLLFDVDNLITNESSNGSLNSQQDKHLKEGTNQTQQVNGL